jgi:imidazolonepropionase
MLVLRNIAQMATCPPANPQHDAGLIERAALVVNAGEVAWSGVEADLPPEYAEEQSVDCDGSLVIPGLIDCHTHLCFGGWRGEEFDQLLRGQTYQEIAAGGGGIKSTVMSTRSTTLDELKEKARRALDEMLLLGVTTVECKSGYGLEPATEIKQLQVYRLLDAQHSIDLVPTFLGAHIVPPEYRESRERYVELLCEDLIPDIAGRRLARFCDAFVEEGAYTVAEGRRILQTASKHGLGVKLHADQLSDGGGALLASELSAVSAEHLEYISEPGIEALARSRTVAVSLPLASLYLREKYLPARRLIERGVRVAVATDFNPGSAPSYHLPLALTLACINQRMTPQESLMGATTVAARALSLERTLGSLEPGFAADLALIDAPSLNHWLYHLRPNACIGVMKKGEWVSGDALRRQLA